MKTTFQGNVCSCGGVWFNLAIPESEPSFCPYCSKKIDQDILEQGFSGQNMELPEGIKQGMPKANGQEDIKMTAKICDFCTNEVFFDIKDASRAVTCPYCAGRLVAVSQQMPMPMPEEQILKELQDSFMNIIDINEMLDKTVEITMKGSFPFFKRKPKVYIFGGMDQLSMMVKLKTIDKGEESWISMKDVKLIKPLTVDETIKEVEKK